MNDRILTERLKSLRDIRPDAVFLTRARTRIMDAIAPQHHYAFKTISLKTLIPLFRMSLVMGTLSLFLFVGAYQSSHEPTEIVASLNENAIQAERPQATGDKANADYWNDVSPVINLALTDIADPSTNWGSANQIKQSIAVLYKNN